MKIDFKVKCIKDYIGDGELLWKKEKVYDGYTENDCKFLAIETELGPYARIAEKDTYIYLKEFNEYFDILTPAFAELYQRFISTSVMTTKEAVSVLKNIDKMFREFSKKERDALNMAIVNLELLCESADSLMTSIEKLLNKNHAYIVSSIEDEGCHIGRFKSLEADVDGDWVICADIDKVSITEK